MGLHNFHPRNALLLDGYFLLKKVYPGINVFDLDECKKKLDMIIYNVVFSPWTGEPHNPGFWLNVSHSPKATSQTLSDKVIGNYALSALAPSGVFIRSMRRTDLVATFGVEGQEYAQFADGTVVRILPSLDRKFLELHVSLESIKRQEKIDESKKLDFKTGNGLEGEGV